MDDTHRAHRWTHSGLGATVAEHHGRALTSVIGMVDDRLKLALSSATRYSPPTNRCSSAFPRTTDLSGVSGILELPEHFVMARRIGLRGDPVRGLAALEAGGVRRGPDAPAGACAGKKSREP